MKPYYDEKECQAPEGREAKLLAALPKQLAYATVQCPYYQQLFADLEVASITSRELLATLPITRKSDLIEMQRNTPLFAGVDAACANIGRLFQSPGPINDPEGGGNDWWRMGRAFYAAGFRTADKVQNCLSYHLTPGGFIMDSGAKACGCVVIPAGPGQTEQQLNVIENLKPEGFCGTPSFLKILLDKAQQQGRDISSITKALVTGEALPESLRHEISAQGVSVLQAYASADVGLIAYESDALSGLIVAEDIIVEIVRPGSQEPVQPGEVGEVVITNFSADYPLVRFATGDLSAVLPGESPCGRSNMRIKGWLGRADQTAKIKGMFVHPVQIERVLKSHAELAKLRLSISRVNGNDHMLLQCELASDVAQDKLAGLIKDVASSLQVASNLNGEVEIVASGNLANDGKIIDDLRSLD
mgnify:CR=1 FL=1